MSDTNKKTDDEKRDDVLKRMLSTPPSPDVKKPLTNPDAKEKQDGTPAKK